MEPRAIVVPPGSTGASGCATERRRVRALFTFAGGRRHAEPLVPGAAAARLRAEAAALAPPEQAVRLLERLAGEASARRRGRA